MDFAADGPNRNATEFVTYYLDASRSIGIDEIEGYVERFSQTQRSELEFGFVSDAIWLRIPVTNSATESKTRFLLLETNWMASMQIWLSTDGGVERLLDETSSKPFHERKVPHRNLVTRVVLEPGQSGVVWLRYTSPGTTALPLNFETEFSFVQRTQAMASKALIFYALMILFIVVAALAFFLFRYAIFPIYVCYATTVLLYVMQRDGFAFQFLWPAWPEFNAISSLPLGCLLAFFAITFSRQYLSTVRSYPVMDRLLRAGMLISLLFIPYGIFIDEQSAKEWATWWVFLVATVLLVIGVRSWFRLGNRQLFFVFGWLGVVTASLTMVLGGYFNFEISRETTLDAIRLAMVFDAIMMGFAMAERVLQVRRERDAALQRQVRSMQANLDLHDRINTLESRYADARALAASSDRMLADATHDIRQPLFALRASLRSMDRDGDAEHLRRATRSLVYLEQLVEEYLARTLATEPTRLDASPELGVSAAVVLTAISDMFCVDAADRGLALRVRPSGALIMTNPMAITRIVSNFVSNALRYTQEGGVLVAVRRRRGDPYMLVYDTGPGLSQTQIRRYRERAVRGQCGIDDGKGLGLDIAYSLATEYGLDILMQSRVGRGTMCGVALCSAPVRKIGTPVTF